MDIIESTLESEPSINSMGFIMIKPHAMRFGYDTLISDVIERIDYYRTAFSINISDRATSVIRNLSLIGGEYRSISPNSKLLRALYHNNLQERGEEHLDTLSKFFVGDAFFLIVASESNSPTLYSALTELKGKSALFSRDGTIARNPTGLRGALIEPQIKLEGEPITQATEHLLYNNVIHTSDNEYESALMFRTLFPNIEYITGMKRKYIERFVNTHISHQIIPLEG